MASCIGDHNTTSNLLNSESLLNMNDDDMGLPRGSGVDHGKGSVAWERATLEKLVFATIREQQAARRWRLFSRLLWLAFFGFIAWMVYSANSVGASVSTPHTAVIEIRGEFASDAEASAENVIASLRSAFEDQGAQAVVLLIDSPGGSPVQAGIVNDEITRLKALLDPFSPQDEAQRAYIQGMLAEIHAQFIAVVKTGRGDRLKESPDTFSGLVWSGQQAVALGLADGLGSLDSVAREIVKAEDIVDYTQRENVGLRLARQLGASMGQGIFMAARSAGVQLK